MITVKGKRGQTLTIAERNIVLDVLEQFQQTMNKSKAVEACSETTGRSPRMIYKLAKEKERGTLKPPKKSKRPHIKSHMRIMKYKSDVRSCIRRIIHSCFVQNIPPVLNTVVDTLNSMNLFPAMKRGTLYNLLKDMGFEYKRRGTKGIFVEKKDIVNYRHQYLQKIKEAREQNKTIIYTGKLGFNIDNIWGKSKVDENTTEKSSNESNGVIVLLTAGFIHGFIKSTKLILMNKTDKAEMDSEKYENWVFNELLPNCPRGAVIVMDDAKYNLQKVGNIPNSSWLKHDIIEWFESTGIEVDYTLSVLELLQVLNSIKDDYEDYKIDCECEQLGFEVLRLPPHHRELNAICMVWDQMKDYTKANYSSYKKDDMLGLIDSAYASVTSDDWLNYVTEVKANEDFLWQADHLQDDIDSLIAKLQWTRSKSSHIN